MEAARAALAWPSAELIAKCAFESSIRARSTSGLASRLAKAFALRYLLGPRESAGHGTSPSGPARFSAKAESIDLSDVFARESRHERKSVSKSSAGRHAIPPLPGERYAVRVLGIALTTLPTGRI
jgi:hypothetical protein